MTDTTGSTSRDQATSQPVLGDLDVYEALTSPEFRARLRELAGSTEARVLKHLLDRRGLLTWAHSAGVLADDGLRSLVPPIPPIELRRLTAAPEEDLFLYTGWLDVTTFLTVGRGDADGGLPSRVLDFGCGCGRLLRFLPMAGRPLDAVGADVNRDFVDWCDREISGASAIRSGELPPLDLEPGSFDLIYALSVFSHLDAEHAVGWMSEFDRLLAPGGTAVITTHGYPALRIIAGSEVHQQMFRLTPDDVSQLERTIGAEGFAHVPYTADVVELAQAGKTYGNAFIAGEHALTTWAVGSLRPVRHVPGGLRGWQDIVVFSKPAD